VSNKLSIQIRPAIPGDEVDIMRLVKALALYEKAPEQVVNTEKELYTDLFDLKICDALVAVHLQRIIGFALFYTNYSTWKGKCLYLEDIFVEESYRQRKVGSQLFDEVVRIAQTRGVRRMDWQVLEWNTPALSFYRKKGAVLDPEWVNGRLFFS
jgi:GNAT superfamily N-acetyltransferase